MAAVLIVLGMVARKSVCLCDSFTFSVLKLRSLRSMGTEPLNTGSQL